MRNHIKIVASNFGLNYHNLYSFCLLELKTSKRIGLEITNTICDDGYAFITVPTSGTEELIKLFDEHLKLNAIKYLPLKTNDRYWVYGLDFQICLDSIGGWFCRYYNYFRRTSNSEINVVFGSSIEDCVYKMYKQFEKENKHNKLIEIKY